MDTPTNSAPSAPMAATAARVASLNPVSAKPNAKETPEHISQSLSSNAGSVREVASQVAQTRKSSINNLQSVAEAIDEAVEVLNNALSKKNTSAVIRRDEQLNRYLVTIKDKESGEVVREIPDEALLKFARNLEELRGILFDETL